MCTNGDCCDNDPELGCIMEKDKNSRTELWQGCIGPKLLFDYARRGENGPLLLLLTIHSGGKAQRREQKSDY
jgi:hypothetical protein